MNIWPHMEQRSEAWFRARAGRPTASQFSRIITAAGKDSSSWEDYAVELVAECIRPDEIPAFTGNRHTDRGNELEPEARREFARTMGFEVDEVGFVTRDDEIAGCSPDGMIRNMIARAVADYMAGLELKCPMAKVHAGYLINGGLPDEYKAQVHGGMAVTGLRWWYFMSYCPGLAPLILRVERDDYTAKLEDALDRFLIFYAERRRKILPLLLGKEAA